MGNAPGWVCAGEHVASRYVGLAGFKSVPSLSISEPAQLVLLLLRGCLEGRPGSNKERFSSPEEILKHKSSSYVEKNQNPGKCYHLSVNCLGSIETQPCQISALLVWSFSHSTSEVTKPANLDHHFQTYSLEQLKGVLSTMKLFPQNL